MKKTMLLAVAMTALMSIQTVHAQDVKTGDFRTMTTEEVQAIAAKAQADFDNMKSKASDAKSEMKEAKKAYTEAAKQYKKLSKQMNAYKKQLKDAQKALKLRAKLSKLSQQ